MLLATALLAGCAFDDPQDNWSKPLFQADDSEEVPVTFNVSSQNNADLTRAETSIVTFDEGEAVRVFVKQNKAGEATSYAGYNFTAAATGQSVDLDAPASPNPKPYFPAGVNSTVDAYAYYPATAGTTFSVADDQSSDAAYKASDLMWASNRTITKDVNDGKNNLKMNHQMAQLRVSANPAEGSTIEITKIQVVAKKSVTFTPEGSVASATTDDAAGVITARLGKGEAYVLIPPQLISNVQIKVLTGEGDDKTATYTFASEGSFQAGCSYGVDITVAADQLGMTTAIANWNGMGSVVIMPSGNLVISPISTQLFTGQEIKPAVTVKRNGETLVENVDYEVQYLNNISAGTAIVVVSGMAGTDHEGCVGVAPFTISSAQASILYDGKATGASEIKTYGDEPFIKHLTNQGLQGAGDGTVTYTSSDETVATVNPTTGEVTIVKPGITTITATVTDGLNFTYPVKTATYTLQIDKAPATISFKTPDPSVTWSANSTENNYSQTAQQKTANNTDVVPASAATVTYSIIGNTNTCEAEISGSTVSFGKAGSVSILATVTDNDYYTFNTKTASYTLTVNPHAGKLTLSPNGGTIYFGSTGTFTVTDDYNTGGAITVASGNTDVATATYDSSSKTVTITTVAAGSTTITVTCAATDYYAQATAEYDLVVGVSTPGVTTPTVLAPTYNGDPQPLLTAGSTTGGTMKYRFRRYLEDYDFSEWSTEVPMATNAGAYEVQYMIVGNDNFNSIEYKDLTQLSNVHIAKATPEGVWSNSTVSIGCGASFTRTLTITGVKGESFTTSYSSSQEEYATVNASGEVTGKAKGSAKITASSAETANYKALSMSYDLTVVKGTPVVTNLTARNLTYDGTAQNLVTTGKTSGGTLEYSTNNSSWSQTVPSRTNADDYTVYYRVVGDDNYENLASTPVPVTISPKVVNSPTVVLSQSTYTYDGNAKEPTVTAVRDGQTTIPTSEYTVSYSYNTHAGNATETPTVTITDNDKGNYTVNGNQTFTINKATGYVTLSAAYGDMIPDKTRIFTVSTHHTDGALSVSSSNNALATASISGTSVTVTGKTRNSSPTITVTCAATRDYKEAKAEYIAYVAPSIHGSDLTNSHLGWTISQSGYAFPSGARCDAAGEEKIAMVAYVGNVSGGVDTKSTARGLAIALWDVPGKMAFCIQKNKDESSSYTSCGISSTTNPNGFDATAASKILTGVASTSTYINNIPKGHEHPGAQAITDWINSTGQKKPTGTSGWFLPSIGQQMLMIGTVRENMVNAGGEWGNGFYWSSTEERRGSSTYNYHQYHCNNYQNCSNTRKNRPEGQGTFRLCFGF